jgi:hypothetical protein
MPIKFRCQNCRQFLGISRAQAGMVVDCPACGRTLRVPNLDGTVESLPAPEMDLDDSSLAKALDELASIGKNNVSGSRSQPKSQPGERVEELEPAPQQKPVVLKAQQRADPVAPPKRVGPATAESDVTAPARSPSRELESLARSPSLMANVEHDTPRQGWLSARHVFLLSCTIGITAAGVGYVAGRIGGANKDTTGKLPDRNNVSVQKGNHRGRSGQDPFAAVTIHGRITYKTTEAGSLPDSGARILVLPAQRKGEAKLSVAGFRVSDSASDFRVAKAVMKELGGAVAIADEKGNYELPLSTAGDYRILVLSHYQARDAEEPIDPELVTLLATYFDRPNQLLGRLRYESIDLRYKGDAPILWDHSFDKSD